LPLPQASLKIHSGKVRPSDLTEACLAQMERTTWLNCYVTKCREGALEAAKEADKRQAEGRLLGPLDGVPYAAKDNLCTRGILTTACSDSLSSFVPPYDSTATERLGSHGALLVGKTNMDEFGMGSATSFSRYGATFNPWSPHPGGCRSLFVPGGSSGGSAAAVATGSCFAALGSDTGGSVRQPAAFCGVVGLKPSYGLVPRHGLISYASSMDTVGILARSVLDAAMVLDAIAGQDVRDSTCVPMAGAGAGARLKEGWGAYARGIVADPECLGQEQAGQGQGQGRGGRLRGVTVGIPEEFNVAELDTGIRRMWEETVRVAATQGARVVTVSVPSVPQALAAYAVIASAEASSNLSRYDGVRYGTRQGAGAGVEAGARPEREGLFKSQGGLHEEFTRTRMAGFGDEVKRRILSGTFVLCSSAYHSYYELAVRVRERLRREFLGALELADVLLAPTAPFPPFPCKKEGAVAATDPAALLLNDVLTVPASLVGLPALSIPGGTMVVVGVDGLGQGQGGRVVKREGVGGGGSGAGCAGSGVLLPLGMQVCVCVC
ncbi:unnamed protein product, partial [Discosporangium mesarthrocarpum]